LASITSKYTLQLYEKKIVTSIENGTE